MPDNERLVQALLSDREVPWEAEQQVLERLLAQDQDPDRVRELLLGYAEQRHQLNTGLRESRKTNKKLKHLVDKLTDIPWYSGTVLETETGAPDRVLVSTGSALLLAGSADEVDIQDIKKGQRVFLSQERNCIMGADPTPPRCSETGEVERILGDRLILKVREVEKLIVGMAGPLLRHPPKKGRIVAFNRETLLAYEILPDVKDERTVLDEIDSEVTLDQIGGIGNIVNEICDEIVLELFYPELLKKHQMRPAKGVLLVSAPGNGKTMLAKGLANFVREIVPDGQVKFLTMPPGSHRHWLYGMSDQIIINTFKTAKDFARKPGNKCILFLDEIDNWGRRSNGIGNTIDARVMGTLLAQIDGTDDKGNILLIGASNRADDMLDAALLRPGRFGDNVYRIPPPDREASRDIFTKYLLPELTYRENGRILPGTEAVETFTDAVVARIFAPNGDAMPVASLVMRDGTRMDVRAGDIISGAIIENAVRKAKLLSCKRALSGREGIVLEDLLDAVDAEFQSAAQRLKSPQNARDILGISPDADFRVELPAEAQRMSSRTQHWLRN